MTLESPSGCTPGGLSFYALCRRGSQLLQRLAMLSPGTLAAIARTARRPQVSGVKLLPAVLPFDDVVYRGIDTVQKFAAVPATVFVTH